MHTPLKFICLKCFSQFISSNPHIERNRWFAHQKMWQTQILVNMIFVNTNISWTQKRERSSKIVIPYIKGIY
jgi:hypothetical protein